MVVLKRAGLAEEDLLTCQSRWLLLGRLWLGHTSFPLPQSLWKMVGGGSGCGMVYPEFAARLRVLVLNADDVGRLAIYGRSIKGPLRLSTRIGVWVVPGKFLVT